MATLYIDNKPYEVKPGKNLLETCLTLGFDLPYFCWHPALGSVGACRQCAIKVFKDENDKKGRIVMSCMEGVGNNQRISIADKDAHQFREGVIEWLMTNHPHDCAVCDEGGSCHLQDMTVMTGHAYRRFEYKKRTYRNQDLGPFINHEMNRCIQCYRCVRFYKDYAGGKDLDAFASRNQVYFGRTEDGTLESEFSGNLSEVCPTGVFTDKTLKDHYTRKWDLTMAPSVCQHCSLGCNIIAGERYGSLRMVANRYNGAVNGYFICDRGRFGYEHVNATDRINEFKLNGAPVTGDQALAAATECVKNGKVIGIGSPRASLESNYALKTLVGNANFFNGVSDSQFELAKLAVSILKTGPRTLSMKEVELADAMFVLGEDLTNTAPMMALAVRQAIRQQPMQEVEKLSIPRWNDAAARELIQDKTGPLFIASVTNTKLDDVATKSQHSAPADIARLGFAVANLIDSSSPAVSGISSAQQALAKEIAAALMAASSPVVLSGSSCGSAEVMMAAANVAQALAKKNKNSGVVLILPDSNSLGLALLGSLNLASAMQTVASGKADSIIILENDLYRHAETGAVDAFLQKCRNVVVMDCVPSKTTDKATLLIPGGTFADSDGTLISNEGRAQRFFQVYESKGVLENWRRLMHIGTAAGNAVMSAWKSFNDVTSSLSKQEKNFVGVESIVPNSDFRVAGGQRIPREPHRFSGRTSMLANVNVSEPKPAEDPDSGMSYTMEGFRGQPPSSMIPFFWSPGWNSVQSVNKYQEEVGAALRGGDPGKRLIEGSGSMEYFKTVPPAFEKANGKFWMVSTQYIFGSEQLSAQSRAVSKRVPTPHVVLGEEDAKESNAKEGDTIALTIGDTNVLLPVKVISGLPRGVAGLPSLPGIPFAKLPAWGTIRK